MYYVYGHYRNTDNIIFYIGVAKSLKRFTSKYSRNKYWNNIVNKHNFHYKILFESDNWKDCLSKEKELILFHGRLDLKTGILCNMTDGGEGCCNLSLESKQKMSKSKNIKDIESFREKCRIRMTGTKATEETKLKMSNSHKKVDKSYLRNRVFSEEHRKNISKGKKGIPIGVGKVLTDAHKKAISDGTKPRFNDTELNEIIIMYNNNFSLRKIAIKFKSSNATIKKYIIKSEGNRINAEKI